MIDEDAFRAEVLAFLSATLSRKGHDADETPENWLAPGRGVTRAREFQHKLFDADLAGITWPVEVGGRGLPAGYQRVFDREAAAFKVPPQALAIGLGMVGPAILMYGTDEQKQTFIPRLLRGDDVWCELFSEPGAGSDLAGVQTRAELDGDTWILDGQKVWTSGAQHSDRAACLARTDRDCPKREGITMFLVDMHASGITVRPLRQMTGDAHFNEVFLDRVPVAASDVLGGVNGGWKVARTTLAHERETLSNMGSGGSGRGGIAAIADEARARGLIDRPEIRDRLADLRIRQMILRYLGQYVAANAKRGRGSGGEASLLKLAMANLVQHSAEVAIDIAGPAGVAWPEGVTADTKRADRWSDQLLNSRSASIGGGTNEVVKNVIAERVLGLPRDLDA